MLTAQSAFPHRGSQSKLICRLHSLLPLTRTLSYRYHIQHDSPSCPLWGRQLTTTYDCAPHVQRCEVW